MKRAAISVIAGLIVILMIILLNSFCAGCVYSQQNAVPSISMKTLLVFGKSYSGDDALYAAHFDKAQLQLPS